MITCPFGSIVRLRKGGWHFKPFNLIKTSVWIVINQVPWTAYVWLRQLDLKKSDYTVRLYELRVKLIKTLNKTLKNWVHSLYFLVTSQYTRCNYSLWSLRRMAKYTKYIMLNNRSGNFNNRIKFWVISQFGSGAPPPCPTPSGILFDTIV